MLAMRFYVVVEYHIVLAYGDKQGLRVGGGATQVGSLEHRRTGEETEQ